MYYCYSLREKKWSKYVLLAHSTLATLASLLFNMPSTLLPHDLCTHCLLFLELLFPKISTMANTLTLFSFLPKYHINTTFYKISIPYLVFSAEHLSPPDKYIDLSIICPSPIEYKIHEIRPLFYLQVYPQCLELCLVCDKNLVFMKLNLYHQFFEKRTTN